MRQYRTLRARTLRALATRSDCSKAVGARMRIAKSRRAVLGDLVAVAGIATGFASVWPRAARSASIVRVLLDRRPDGAAAPFLVAQARGLFRTEGVDVTADTANGSQDAIERVARGDADIAIADFDALI